MDIGRILNVQKTFKRCSRRLLKVLCTFHEHPITRGYLLLQKGLICRISEINLTPLAKSIVFQRSTLIWSLSPCNYIQDLMFLKRNLRQLLVRKKMLLRLREGFIKDTVSEAVVKHLIVSQNRTAIRKLQYFAVIFSKNVA